MGSLKQNISSNVTMTKRAQGEPGQVKENSRRHKKDTEIHQSVKPSGIPGKHGRSRYPQMEK